MQKKQKVISKYAHNPLNMTQNHKVPQMSLYLHPEVGVMLFVVYIMLTCVADRQYVSLRASHINRAH